MDYIDWIILSGLFQLDYIVLNYICELKLSVLLRELFICELYLRFSGVF